MPIDPNIVLGIQPPKFNSPFGVLADWQQLTQQRQAQQEESQLRQARLREAQQAEQERQRALAEKDTLNQAWSAALQGDKIDRPTLQKRMADSGLGHLIPTVTKQLDEMDEAAQKAAKTRADSGIAEADYWGTIAGGLQEALKNPDGGMGTAMLLLKHAKDNGHDVAPYVSMLTDGGQPLSQVVATMRGMSQKQRELMTSQQNADTTSDRWQTEKPSYTPNAQGLTPSQQSEADARAAALKETQGYHAQELGLQKQNAALQQKKFDATYGAGVDENGNKLPENPTARAIADYKMPPPSARSVASGPGKALMDEVMRLNPAYDGTQFQNRQKTRIAWTSGTQGQQINAMNTAIGHLDQLSGVLANLNNGDVQVANKAWNWLKTQLGDASASNFETLKDALAGEVASVLSKGQATVAGINDAQSHIKSAQSPAQLAGYIKTQIPLLGSKLAALNYQYHQAMGEQDPFSALSPDAKQTLQKYGFDPEHPTQQGAGSGPALGATVRMKAPNGQVSDVPADQVEHYKARGAVVVR